jgi:Transglutaminase-like superfamily
MNRRHLVFAFVVGLLLAIASQTGRGAQAGPPPFDTMRDLLRRHPTLGQGETFQTFQRGIALTTWSERTDPATRQRVLNVYRADGAMFSSELGKSQKGVQELLSQTVFPAADVNQARERARGIVRTTAGLPEPSKLTPYGARRNGTWTVDVEVQVPTATGWKYLNVDASGSVIDLSTTARGKEKKKAADDDMASNELHHPDLFAKRPSLAAARRRPNFLDALQELMDGMVDEVDIGPSTPASRVFTFADTVPAAEGTECDELAVIFVSYARAMGFKAHLRFLSYDGGAHAFLEVRDPRTGRWVPVDPTNKKIDVPDYYACETGKVLHGMAKPDDRISRVDLFDESDPAHATAIHDPDDERLSSWVDFHVKAPITLAPYDGPCPPAPPPIDRRVGAATRPQPQ